MANYFDQFDAAKVDGKVASGNFFDKFDKPQEQRGIVSEIGTQIYAGATIDLPKMVGQAMQWMGEDGKPFGDTGRELTEWAAKRETDNPDLAPQVDGAGLVRRALSSGARALAPSTSMIVPAVLAAPAGMVAAGAAGAAGAFGLFGASQAQETYDKLLKDGVSEEDARKAGYINLLIEGGGETLGTIAGAKLLGVLGTAVGKGLSPVQAAIAGQTSKDVWMPFAKQLPKTAAIEIGTEFGQGYGEGLVEEAYGAKPVPGQSPLEQGVHGAEAALGMTALLAPFGLAGFGLRAKRNGKVADALQDPEADPVNRIAAAKLVYDGIYKVDQKAAEAWGRNSSIAISAKAPIVLDESFAKQPEAVVTETAVRNVLQAETIDQAIASASEGVLAESDVTESLSGELAVSDIDQAISRAERTVREQPAYDALDAQKATELDAVQQEGRESGLLPIEPGDLAPVELAVGTPQKTSLQTAFEAAKERARIDREGKDLLARMEALQAGKEPASQVAAPVPAKAPVEVPAESVAEAAARAAGIAQTPGQAVLGVPGASEVTMFGKKIAELTDDQLRLGAKSHRMSAFREAAKVEIARRAQAVPKATDAMFAAALTPPERRPAPAIPNEGSQSPNLGTIPPNPAQQEQRPASEGAAPNLPAVKQQLFVQRGSERFPVESFEDAARKWGQFFQAAVREGAGGSGGSIGGATIVDQTGREVARISQNGRVWPPGEWKSGIKPLYDPHGSALSHPSNQFEMPQTEEQARAGKEAVERLKKSGTIPEILKAEVPAPGAEIDVTPSKPYAPVKFLGRTLDKLTRKELKVASEKGKNKVVRAAADAEIERRMLAPLSEAETKRRATLKAKAKERKTINVDRDSIVPAIIKLGGLNVKERNDIVRDKSVNTGIPGVGFLFTKNGHALDDMITMLEGHGFVLPAELADVDGGAQALRDKIEEEFNGGRKHWSLNGDGAANARNAQDKLDEERQQDMANQAQAEGEKLGVEIDLTVTPEELVEDNVRPTGQNLARQEVLDRLANADPDTFERLAMEYAEQSEDAFYAAVVAELKRKTDETDRRNQADDRAGAQESEPAATAEPTAEVARFDGAPENSTTGVEKGAEANRPALDLAAQTAAALKAKEAQAATGKVEEKTAAVRDRDTAILTPPEGTAPAREITDAQRTPTAQPGLFGAVAALRQAADAIEQAVKPELPARTADTMGDAISMSSPNGRVSKRAKDAATDRLGKKLFGEEGLQRGEVPQPSERERLLAQAKELRELADRGMKPIANRREADRLEQEAAALPPQKSTSVEETEQKVGTKPMFSRAAAPHFYSELERGIERASMKAAPAAAWKDYLRGLVSKGVKQDEIQWSGISEWLDLQTGKVTKEQVSAYLAQNGVKVEETMLGEEGKAEVTAEIDRIRVDLDALGYDIIDNHVDEIYGVVRRSDGKWFSDSLEAENDDKYAPLDALPADVMAKVERFAELRQAEDDSYHANDTNTTKFKTYTLPGGENYRELLLTLPNRDTDDADLRAKWWASQDRNDAAETTRVGNEIAALAEKREKTEFRSSHFDQPNILAHVRFNERTDAEGRRVLFIEEFQSDWSAKGRREGFSGEQDNKPLKATKGDKFWRVEAEDGKFISNVMDADITEQTPEAAILEARRRIKNRRGATSLAHEVPRAPFVEKTDAWLTLSLKRMIRYASENGFDRVAWTTGEQQADRYSLSKTVEKIFWKPSVVRQAENREGKYVTVALHGRASNLGLYIDEKNVIHDATERLTSFVGKNLDDVIGKAASAKIAASKAGELQGDGLKIGGEGMLAFYDKIVPNIANDVLKKLGGGRVRLMDVGQTTSETKVGETYAGVNSGFDITPAMRERAIQGQALFARQSKYTTDASGAPLLSDGNIQIADPAFWRNLQGLKVYTSKIIVDGKHVGFVTLGWKDGRVEQLNHIDVREDYMGNGYAEGVVRAILTHNKGGELYATTILPEAREFWAKMGTEFFTTETGEDGILTEKTYTAARGTQGAAREAGENAAGQGTDGENAAGPGDAGRRGSRQALSVAEVEAIVAPLAAKLKNVPKVRIVAEQTDIPSVKDRLQSAQDDFLSKDEKAQERGQKEIAGFEQRPIEGAYVDGEIWLVAGNLRTAARAKEVFAHEAVGHLSVEQMLDEADAALMPKFVRQINMLDGGGNRYIKELGRIVDQRQPGLSKDARAKEIIALVAERGDQIKDTNSAARSLYQRIIDGIKAFFKLAFDMNLSDQDVRDIVASAERWAQGEEHITAMVKGKLDSAPMLSRGDQTASAAFKAWFGDSKVVDADGKPMPVNHQTHFDITEFDRAAMTKKFGRDPERIEAIGHWFTDSTNKRFYGPVNVEAFLSIKKPQVYEDQRWSEGQVAWRQLESDIRELGGATQYRSELKEHGYDGVLLKNTDLDGQKQSVWIAFEPEQIKSATGNRGTFDASNPDIRFSRSEQAMGAVHGGTLDSARTMFSDIVRSDRTLNRLISKFNTPYHIAETQPSFKPVYEEAQNYNQDVSRISNETADLAPSLLPRIESFSDFKKTTPSTDDVKATADALYAGTLWGSGSPMEGRVWTDEELRSGRAVDNDIGFQAFTPLNDAQIALYRQALAAVGHSLTEHGKSLIWRLAKQHDVDLHSSMTLDRMVGVVNQIADQQIEGKKARMRELEEAGNEEKAFEKLQAEVKELESFKEDIAEIQEKTEGLIEHGYFPAMRFGAYAVNVQQMQPDGRWKEQYFGRFETQTAANIAKKELAREYPDSQITSGVMNEDAHKLFQGLNVDALELFAKHMKDENGNPISADPLMQEYFRVATTERSSLKRQIHRKGTPGFSKDVARALAQFTVSNATSASRNYHAAGMLEKVQRIKKGDLQAYATRYVRYLQDPQEENPALRGFLANYYILGSLAFGAVNMTQPVLMTAPYLSAHTSWTNAMGQLGRAAMDLVGGLRNLPADERAVYEKAKKTGLVSPQEIHQIRAESRASMMGDSPVWQKLEGIAESKGIKLPGKLLMRKAAFLWGSIYSLTEQFNRGTTFLAAYRIAKANHHEDPYAFAKDAVDATQGVYARSNRPEVSRGNIGSVVMTFKQFGIAYLELAKRLYTQDKKAFAILMLTLMALAGAEGLPFAEDIEDLIDTIGQWMGYKTNSKKKLRKLATELLGKDMANVLLHGASAIPGVPIDVANRLGMHNIIPGSAMMKVSEPDKTRDIVDILGPAATLFKNAGSAVEGLATGKPGETKLLAPMALQNVFKGAEMFDKGQYRDMKGRKVMDVDGLDAFVKLIGFQPAKVAAETRIVGQNQQDIALVKVVESAIADQWAHGLVDKDPAAVQKARERLRDWNNDNPDARIRIDQGQILRRLKDLRASREERFAKTAPKEIRGEIRSDLRGQ